MITEEKVIEMFKEGFDCGQVITMAIADDLNIDRKTALKSAAAFAVQCPYCIDAYTNACLERGCDQDQIIEVAHVVATIKAGATLAFGVQSKNILEKKSMK